MVNKKRLDLPEGISLSRDEVDLKYLMRTLDTARNNIDTTRNKTIGALVVRDGEVIGEGYRKTIVLSEEPYGSYGDVTFHAEHVAIVNAGKRVKGATLYTTLEPCLVRSTHPNCIVHHPCAHIIYRVGIERVVIGILDKDFGGGGAEYLISNGIEVALAEGIDEREFRDLIEGSSFLTEELRISHEDFVKNLRNG